MKPTGRNPGQNKPGVDDETTSFTVALKSSRRGAMGYSKDLGSGQECTDSQG